MIVMQFVFFFKRPFCEKIKKSLSRANILGAVIVAPIFLDICL